MKCTAIILAAGQGKRMKSSVQKQFLQLGKYPVLYYSLKAFQDSPEITDIVLVCGKTEIDYCKDAFVQKYHIDTKPELDMLSDALSNEMQILVDQHKELYALRREQPSAQLDADIDSLTAQLRPLRRELRLCGKIAEYAPRMLRQVQESTSPSTENHLPNKAKERRHSLWR